MAKYIQLEKARSMHYSELDFEISRLIWHLIGLGMSDKDAHIFVYNAMNYGIAIEEKYSNRNSKPTLCCEVVRGS